MVHCRATSELAARLGLGAEVQDPLTQAFERWDRKGVPGSAGGTMTMAARIVHLRTTLSFESAANTGTALAPSLVKGEARNSIRAAHAEGPRSRPPAW
jgi:hypothetical protein